jgi:hypothetical protein
MTPLPQTFRRSGWDYKVLSRDGDVAVLEQTKAGCDTRYEVVVVQRHNGYEIGGKVMPPGEAMPSPEQWGRLGWTLMDRESAFKKSKTVLEEFDFK